MLPIIILFIFFISTTSNAAVQDFCLADLTVQVPPATPARVLKISQLMTSSFPAFDNQPIHQTSGSSEIVVVTEGSLIAGFISSANNVYYKNIEKGDTIVFPEGLLHFIVNAGNDTAKAFFIFSSSEPRTQLTSLSLFGNNLKANIVGKFSFLDVEDVIKYKKLLGGSSSE